MTAKHDKANKKKKKAAAAEKATEEHGGDGDGGGDYEEEDRGLLTKKRNRLLVFPTRRRQPRLHDDYHYYDGGEDDDGENGSSRQRRKLQWIRPYWLGLGLFLVLLAFWVLDTLKDPIFAALTGGNLDKHQPPAKLFSVFMTLALVLFLEYVSNEKKRRRQSRRIRRGRITQTQGEERDLHWRRSDEDVLDGGGTWSKMKFGRSDAATARGGGFDDDYYGYDEDDDDAAADEDRVSSAIFISIGMPYCIAFGIMAYLLQFNRSVALVNPDLGDNGNSMQAITTADGTIWGDSNGNGSSGSTRRWYVLGYFLYAGIESFGSIAVATFWSFTNSNLSLHDAEQYYGLVIAIAQLGAIAGSTIVTTHVWSNITLIVMACLVIILHVLVMTAYDRRFPPSAKATAGRKKEATIGTAGAASLPPGSRLQPHRGDDRGGGGDAPTLWSGVYLILQHNYVLLILGTSCLYEVSLTCLNYQMTLMGWKRFEQQQQQHSTASNDSSGGMSFTQFMGHYGQMVNASSLLFSSMLFPFFIRRFGLRITLRLFPSLLMFANVLAFLALPGNLTVLFVSMSILKAMTYSIHDPSKEILYLPTSNAIKFKAKFWIDVVGARVAKAFGSAINNFAGSVDRSIRVASTPSLLTAALLWFVCYGAGKQFEELIATGTVVGVDDDGDDSPANERRLYLDVENSDDPLVADTVDEDDKEGIPQHATV